MKKTILLTNDDGYLAQGIRHLKALFSSEYHVYIVAPDRERSAVSMGITINSPLRINRINEREFTIDGTPTDCINVALQQVIPQPPDFIVSGMNMGENLAEDVFYSGTVAAAYAGYLFNIPSLAVSLVGDKTQSDDDKRYNFEQGAAITADTLEKLMLLEKSDVVYNLNIPNPCSGKTVLTSLGKKQYQTSIEERIDPRGGSYYWLGTGSPNTDGSPGTDLRAIKNGDVSLSTLKYDLNCPQELQKLNEIFK